MSTFEKRIFLFRIRQFVTKYFAFPVDALHMAFETFNVYYETKEAFDRNKEEETGKQNLLERNHRIEFYDKMKTFSEYEEAIYVIRICLHLAWNDLLYDSPDVKFRTDIDSKGQVIFLRQFVWWIRLPRDNESVNKFEVEPSLRFLVRRPKKKMSIKDSIEEQKRRHKAMRRYIEMTQIAFLEFIQWKLVAKTYFWYVTTSLTPITGATPDWASVDDLTEFLLIFAPELFKTYGKTAVARVTVERITNNMNKERMGFNNSFDYMTDTETNGDIHKSNKWEQLTLRLGGWVKRFNHYMHELELKGATNDAVKMIEVAEKLFAMKTVHTSSQD